MAVQEDLNGKHISVFIVFFVLLDFKSDELPLICHISETLHISFLPIK